MTLIELRSLMAAQIFAALATRLPENTPEEYMKHVAETAAKAAKAVQDAVTKVSQPSP